MTDTYGRRGFQIVHQDTCAHIKYIFMSFLCAYFFPRMSNFYLNLFTVPIKNSDKEEQNNYGYIEPGILVVYFMWLTVDNKLRPVLSLTMANTKRSLITLVEQPRPKTQQLIPSHSSAFLQATNGNRKEMENMSQRNKGTQETLGSANLTNSLKKSVGPFLTYTMTLGYRETNMGTSSRCVFFWGLKNKKYTSSAVCKDRSFSQESREAGNGGCRADDQRSTLTGVSSQWRSPRRSLPPGSSPETAHFGISPETSCFLLLRPARRVLRNVPGKFKKVKVLVNVFGLCHNHFLTLSVHKQLGSQVSSWNLTRTLGFNWEFARLIRQQMFGQQEEICWFLHTARSGRVTNITPPMTRELQIHLQHIIKRQGFYCEERNTMSPPHKWSKKAPGCQQWSKAEVVARWTGWAKLVNLGQVQKPIRDDGDTFPGLAY